MLRCKSVLISHKLYTKLTQQNDYLKKKEMSRKLRILCLHGYHQSGDKFRMQTGGMRKFLKSQAEFVFLSAPHILKETENEERGWWFSKTDSFSSKDETSTDDGFKESLNFICNMLKTEGQFDGILGFSQGAALAVILISLQQRRETTTDFKFGIIISGFKSRCSKHLKYYNEKIMLPSLHIIGETDEIVHKSVSEELAELFVDPVIMKHNGGHHVPSSTSLKLFYRDFITTQQNRICSVT